MIAEILHQIARMDQPQEPRVYRPRPSLAGPQRCIRQMTYQRMGLETDRDLSGRFLHVLDDSSWHEELTGDWIGKTAYQLHSRQMGVTLPRAFPWLPDREFICKLCNQMVNEQDLHGHIDGILTDLLLTDWLYDHKAVSHFTFEAYWQQKETPDDYFAQLTTYTKALHRDLPDLNRHIMVVKNKNTAGFLEYQSHYDQAADKLTVYKMTRHTGEVIEMELVQEHVVERTIDKFKQVEDHAVTTTLPARPYESDHWRCRYCSYFDSCWSTYAQEVKSKSLAGVVQLDGEEADRIGRYYALNRSIKQLEEQKDEMNTAIVKDLLEHGITKATADKLNVSVSVSERKTIAWDDVPVELTRKLEAYKHASPTTTLRVTAPKAKE